MKNFPSATPHTTSTNGDGIVVTRGGGGGGKEGGVARTAPAWPSSAGARACASDHQRVEAPRPQFLKQKDTQQESIFKRHQETAQNKGRARRKHRGRGNEEHDATTRDRLGTGPPAMAGRGGGSRRVNCGGRQRDEVTPRRDNPGADMDLIAQVEDSNRGQPDEVR